MKLRTRLGLSFLVLSLISMAAVAAVAFQMGRNQIVDHTFERLAASNQLIAKDYSRWLENGARILEATAQRPDLIERTRSITTGGSQQVSAERSAILQNDLQPRLQEASFSGLFLIDARSGLVLVSTDPEQVGVSLGGSEIFSNGLQDTSLDTTAQLPGSSARRTVLATPVVDSSGKVFGVLAGELDMDELAVILAAPDPLRHSEENYLVSANGAALGPLLFAPGSQPEISSPGVETCLDGKDLRGQYADYRGTAVFGVYKWLPQYQTCLVTEIDESEALAPIIDYRTAVISLALLIALLAVGAGFYYAGRLAEPVKSMRDAAERFGQGDLGARMSIAQTQEYAELAEAYNRMADDLQQDIEELESRYRSLFDSVPVGLYQSTPAGKMLEANQMLAAILGYQDVEELKATPTLTNYVDPEDRRRWLDQLRGLGTVQEFEVQVYRKDRTPIWIRHDARLVTREDGDEILEGAVLDITERRQVEQQLHASEARFRSVVQNSQDITSILDAEGNYLYVSPAMERILGHQPEGLVGRNAFGLVHPEDVAGVQVLFGELLASPGTVRRTQLRFQHADGSWRVLEATGTNHLDSPDIGGVVVNSRDVSARVAAEQRLSEYAEELRQSNQELEQFAYVASHDLQEPLRMVSSYVQLLADRYRDRLDGDALEFIDYAVDGAKRMQKLINDLLDFSRVGTRGRALVPVDSQAIVGDALRNVEMRIADGAARVEVVGELPRVIADRGQLTRVFQNLIGNALKFRGNEPPVVKIWAQPNGENWEFAVQDNGIGIDPRFADRVFVIFQRLHNRTEYEGTGIGLAISKKIIERHGGEIWFESELGRGTTFFFTVPAVVTREEQLDAPKTY